MTGAVVRPPRPTCSRCLRQRRRLVEFMACGSPRFLGHRGATRRVRLCERCLLGLLDTLVAPAAPEGGAGA